MRTGEYSKLQRKIDFLNKYLKREKFSLFRRLKSLSKENKKVNKKELVKYTHA